MEKSWLNEFVTGSHEEYLRSSSELENPYSSRQVDSEGSLSQSHEKGIANVQDETVPILFEQQRPIARSVQSLSSRLKFYWRSIVVKICRIRNPNYPGAPPINKTQAKKPHRFYRLFLLISLLAILLFVTSASSNWPRIHWPGSSRLYISEEEIRPQLLVDPPIRHKDSQGSANSTFYPLVRPDEDSRMCQNTAQGQDWIADSQGYLCHYQQVNPARPGCCLENPGLNVAAKDAIPPLRDLNGDTVSVPARYLCADCEETSRCCARYETCVSCCIHPAQFELLNALSKSVKSFHPLFQQLKGGTVFGFCRAKCRTSSASLGHQSEYRSRYCFGQFRPLERMTVLSQPGENIDSSSVPASSLEMDWYFEDVVINPSSSDLTE